MEDVSRYWPDGSVKSPEAPDVPRTLEERIATLTQMLRAHSVQAGPPGCTVSFHLQVRYGDQDVFPVEGETFEEILTRLTQVLVSDLQRSLRIAQSLLEDTTRYEAQCREAHQKALQEAEQKNQSVTMLVALNAMAQTLQPLGLEPASMAPGPTEAIPRPEVSTDHNHIIDDDLPF